MKEHAVVIAGGGPTGVMLAAKLTLTGIEVVIIERRASWTGGREHELSARLLAMDARNDIRVAT